MNKIDKSKGEVDREKKLMPRVGAYIIDIMIISLLCSLICGIRFLNPSYDKYNEASITYSEYYNDYLNNKITINEFNDNIGEVTYNLYKYGTSNYVIALVVIIGYLGVFQKYNKGQTIGKKVMKLKVVSVNKKNVSLINFILRIIPMYILGYGGIFNIIACIFLPHFMSSVILETWVTSVTIVNLLLALIDIEFAIIRNDRRTLHDLLTNTKLIANE